MCKRILAALTAAVLALSLSACSQPVSYTQLDVYKRQAGNGPSSPHIAKWLGDLRSLFPQDIVAVVQNDAIERKGLKQLLLEPELLDNLEPDLNLASTLLMLKDHIPKKSKESARRFIAKIVEEINRMLESDMRRAVTAALNRRAHSPLPSASAIDFPYTIRRNLRHYNARLKTIVPERVYFCLLYTSCPAPETE